MAENGETVAVSEVYESEQGARKGIEALRSGAAEANIVDRRPFPA